MTDGIIQEVFKKYFENIGMLPMVGDDLIDLQQELIEKIKQSIEFHKSACLHKNCCLLEELIGDNE